MTGRRHDRPARGRSSASGRRTGLPWLAAVVMLWGTTPTASQTAARTNPFDDPFVQVTSGIPACPVPAPPTYTEQQIRDLAHERSQRGVSCWLDGRCRLHNSYLYDAEIIPRVQRAVRYDGRFRDTSVWALGQRRHVWLKGCVRDAQQIEQLVTLVARIDDVERVFSELTVGSPR